jgi:hypothetical protein
VKAVIKLLTYFHLILGFETINVFIIIVGNTSRSNSNSCSSNWQGI